MKLNILIIGKNSFLGSNLFKFLKKMNLKPKKVNLDKFLKFEDSYLSAFQFIINFSTNKSYFLRDYKKKYDFDLLVANKIKAIKSKLIVFSTGKVYGPGHKLVENSKKTPIDVYGKNKLISENKIIKIKKNLLILRLSNIVGRNESKKRRKITNLFFDDIRKNLKKNKVIIPKKSYFKDFLLVDDFVKIVYLCILNNVSGVYNLSANMKIYLNSLANKISSLKGAKIFYSNEKTYSFTLSNNKILKRLKIKKKFA